MCWRELLFHKQLTSWKNGLLFVDNVKNGYFSQLYPDVVRRFSGICSLLSLPPRMWLLNVRERKLSGGGSTRKGFLSQLLWTDFTSLVPDFLSLGHGEIKNFEENHSLKRTQKPLRCFTNVKEEYFGQKLGL